MGKIAFIFPGQGSQYVGMGRDFYDNFTVCREVIEQASERSGLALTDILFEENIQINVTEFTQIAMLATEISLLRAVEQCGVKADVTAGLSLGEYAALVASGTMSQEDAFAVVRQRGMLMQHAYPVGGAMVAVLGADTKLVESLCEQTDGAVSVANYNCPGQIVITGEEHAVNRAVNSLKEAGVRKCIPLKVSGPFHSILLKDAGEKLFEVLESLQIQKPNIPYITNVTADYVMDATQVKSLLKRQVYSSVRWEQTIERMIFDGVDTFIEIGPGKTLSGFMKKINKEVTCINIEKVADLDLLQALVQEGND